MSRLKFLRTLTGALLLATAWPVWAAEGGGGVKGGYAWVCRNEKGGVESAELLDFFEGREFYKLNIEKKDTRFEDQILEAKKKLQNRIAPESYAAFEKVLAVIEKHELPLMRGY